MLRNNCILSKKSAIILSLSFIAIASVFQAAEAAEITSATLNKETYLPGQTGYISVTIYNVRDANISTTELSATIDYYYADGMVYVQKFFTSEELPDEIEPGQTETYSVPISLPTNVAPGYVDLMVVARTRFWDNETGRWVYSDNPSQQVKLYIESPYKQSYEDSQEELQNSQVQLEGQETANRNLTVTAAVLGVTTAVFGAIAALLIFIFRRPRPIAQPP